MNVRTKVLTLIILLPLLVVVVGSFRSSATNSKQATRQAKRVPLAVLQSSETLINTDYSRKPVLAPSKDGQSIYSLDSMTGEVFVYERKSKRLRKAADVSNVEAFTVGPQGDLYLAQSDSTVQIVNSAGRRLNRFPTVHPKSIAVLDSGNIVVASPSNGKLLHLYSSRGSLLGSFGSLKMFDSDSVENQFLNEGRVVVGSADQIYYVSSYAPQPYVLRFSPSGQLLGEFQIEGDAVDFQTDLTKDFLRRRRPNQSGGVTIITSATVNPDTGHLWFGLNGLSTHATVYEYDQAGIKVREYAFLLNSNNKRYNVTHVKDIAVSSDSLDVLSWGGTYSFKFSDVLVADAWTVPAKNLRSVKSTWRAWANPFARIMKFWEPEPSLVPGIPQPPDPPCGQAQDYTCTANCPTGTSPPSVDCAAEIATLVTGNTKVITSNSCTAKPIDASPGSTTPGGCVQSVTYCDNSNGATGSLTATLNCTAVPTPTPTPTPEPTPTPAPSPSPSATPGYCLGIADWFSFPSTGCITGFIFGGPCTRSSAFQHRCADPTGYDPFDCSCPDGTTMSPIVIDIDHSGFSMTNAAGGVVFNILNDGVPLPISWTAAGSTNALLVLDRSGNGTIDNGEELFGDVTPTTAICEA